MTPRIFRCRDCGHRMRLFGTECGKCRAEKPAYQLGAIYVPVTILAGFAGVFLAFV